MEQRHVVGLFSRVVGLTLVGMLLSGCPSVYVKSTAGTFTAAGKDATKAIKETSDRLNTALDSGKAVKISGDSSCPIQQARVFVREKTNELSSINAAAAAFPQQAGGNDCKVLIQCARENAGKPAAVSDSCKKACYSKQEGACLAAFEAEYAKELALSDGKLPKVKTDEIERYRKFLVSSEYQRAGSYESQLIGPSLKVLTEYMDLLSKAADEQKSAVGDDAKKLSDNIGKLTANLDKVRKEKLSDEDKKVQAQAQGVITSIGKLAANLDKIAKDAKDEKDIRASVKSNGANVDELIEHLHQVTVGNNYIAGIKRDVAINKVRADLEAQYKLSTSMRERRMLLTERDNFKFSDDKDTTEAIDNVFKSLKKAHGDLVTLVNDPTDEQKRKMAEQSFAVFKSVVVDVVDVVAAVK